nr:hypothetical protein [Comamonas testosteroni]
MKTVTTVLADAVIEVGLVDLCTDAATDLLADSAAEYTSDERTDQGA